MTNNIFYRLMKCISVTNYVVHYYDQPILLQRPSILYLLNRIQHNVNNLIF